MNGVSLASHDNGSTQLDLIHMKDPAPSRSSTIDGPQDNLFFYPDRSPVDALQLPLDVPLTGRVQLLGESVDLFRSEGFLSDDQKSSPHPLGLDSLHVLSPSSHATALMAYDSGPHHNSNLTQLDLSLGDDFLVRIRNPSPNDQD